MTSIVIASIRESAVTLWREEHLDCCPRCGGRREGVPEFGGCDHDWHHWYKKKPDPPTYTYEMYKTTGCKEFIAIPAADFEALIKAVGEPKWKEQFTRHYAPKVCMDPRCLDDSDHAAH